MNDIINFFLACSAIDNSYLEQLASAQELSREILTVNMALSLIAKLPENQRSLARQPLDEIRQELIQRQQTLYLDISAFLGNNFNTQTLG